MRRYKRLFVVAAEGVNTEPQYFDIFNDEKSIVRVDCIGRGKAPPRVLERMKRYLREERLGSSDEAWLVVDKDAWTDTQLAQLNEWAHADANRGFALSNPNFEYWLLLHFEGGNGVSSARDCTTRLRRYLPDYDKSVHPRNFTRQMIVEATQRAKQRDTPPCSDWPRGFGSTVYRLVERILEL